MGKPHTDKTGQRTIKSNFLKVGDELYQTQKDTIGQQFLTDF